MKILTNLITLVRHTFDSEVTPLAPFPELVKARFESWSRNSKRRSRNQEQRTKNQELPDSPKARSTG